MATKLQIFQEIPVTPATKNFIEKYRTEPIRAELSDALGITILSLITYRNKSDGKRIDDKYSSSIKIYIQEGELLRRSCKVLRRMAVVSVHRHITKLLYSELEKYVAINTVRYLGRKLCSINEAIEQFREEYGLLDEEYNFLRLHQHIMRINRKKRKANAKPTVSKK